jgi:hypothetical protein
MNTRNYEYAETIPDDILFEVMDIINGFMEIEK